MHFGHLLAAQDAFEQRRLDRLILVPAARAPLKPNDVASSAEDRLAMLRAAVDVVMRGDRHAASRTA